MVHGKILVKFKSKQELLDQKNNQNNSKNSNKPNPLQKIEKKSHTHLLQSDHPEKPRLNRCFL